ncbi:MFS transporter [Kibdelosporangium phytohabitans]|nr:MFS transporter [Kibdelosporangium phytohabitans]MBE1467886.1 YNFM family putative membrane transporter [Kibdelosporangium phytohabitans]
MDRLTIGMAAGGLASFALLYAPQPVLPLLAQEYQITPGHAALTVGVATGALAVAVLPMSLLSEVVGRRPVILGSVIVSTLIGLLLPFVGGFQFLVVLRAIQGVALAGFPAVAMAYLADRGRLKAIGMLIAGNTFGGMAGRLLAGQVGSYRVGVGLVAVVAAMATGLLIWALPKGGETPSKRMTGGLKSAVSQPLLWSLYAVAFLSMGAFVALYNAIGFRLAAPPLELSPQLASLVFLAYAIGGLNSATLGSQSNRQRVLFGMLGLTAVGIVVTIPTNVVTIAIGFVLLTAGWFAGHAAAGAWVNAEAPSKGPASGLYTGAYYAGASIGGTAGTSIYAAWGWNVLVLVSLSWLSLGSLGIWLALRRNTRSSAKNLSRNTGAPLAR